MFPNRAESLAPPLLGLLRRLLLRLGLRLLGRFLLGLFGGLLGLLLRGLFWNSFLPGGLRRGLRRGFIPLVGGLFLHDQQLFLFFDNAPRLSAEFLVVIQPGQLFVVFELIFLEFHALLPMGIFLTRCSWHAAPVGDVLHSVLAICYPTPTPLSSFLDTIGPPAGKIVCFSPLAPSSLFLSGFRLAAALAPARRLLVPRFRRTLHR